MNTSFQKSQPTPGDVHVSGPLTNLSVAYLQARAAYAASSVFPTVAVGKQPDSYYQFPREFFLRDLARPRAPGTESAGGGFAPTTGTYNCIVEAFHYDMPDQVKANADGALGLDRAAAEFVAQVLLTRKEQRWMDSYFKTGVWGTDIDQSTAWATIGTDVLSPVQVGIIKIWGSTGFKPNTLVISPATKMALRKNTAIKDQFKYTSADSIDEAMLARYFGIERVVIAGAVKTSSLEGNATQTTDFMGTDNALLCYSATAPALMQPSAGYQFSWAGFVGSSDGMRTSRIRADLLGADRIEGEMAYDMKVVAPELGYMLYNVL